MADNLYDVGMAIMREERGVIGWATRNSVFFEHGSIGLPYPIVLGLDFMTTRNGRTNQENCALLDQAARQMIESVVAQWQ